MNVNAKTFVPAAAAMAYSDVAIQFKGHMSPAEAANISESLLYNPVCCEFCSNFLRTLREYYVRSSAANVNGCPAASSGSPPGPHPGIWIGVSDMDHILRHALSSQSVRLDILKKKRIR